MNCSIVNAKPHNMSIDAGGTYDNRELKFTFYGDRTIGADFFVYNMNTNKLWDNKIYGDYATSNNKDYYYNGEEIDTHIASIPTNNDKSFIWKTRVYEDVDINLGKNPTNRLVTGTTKDNPHINGKIKEKPAGYEDFDEKYIYVESVQNLTLPSWIYIDKERRIILDYTYLEDAYCTQLKLKNPFTTYPAVDTAYAISPYKMTTSEIFSGNKIYIASGINIDGTDKDHRPSGGKSSYYLEIDDIYYQITDYNPLSGLLTLGSEDNLSSIEVGTKYTIYSSFVESPYFYFTTEVTPNISSINLSQDGEVIKCSAMLESKSFVKFQYWKVYDITNGDNILVETSEKMYLDALEFVFRGGLVGHSYKVELNIVTQTNWNITKTSDSITVLAMSESDNISSLNYEIGEDNSIILNMKLSNSINKNGGIKILRQSINDDIITYVDTIQFEKTKNTSDVISFHDYKTSNNLKYKYYIICYNPTSESNKQTLYSTHETDWINTEFNTYSIYSLKEVAYERFDVDTDKRIDYDYMYSERRFEVVDVIRPELNVVEKHKINHNIGRDVYVGYSKKPVVSSKKTAYDTFSLSFQLGNTTVVPSVGIPYLDAIKYGWGYTDIINNDIAYYNKLKKIIVDAPPFLIKDYKGNMWFGSIVTYNTEVDNLMVGDKPIMINIDFVETYPIDKVKIMG